MGLKNFGFIDDKFVVSARNKFLQQYTKEIENIYSEDIEKVLNDDWFLKRYLILAYKDEEKAVNYLITCLKWRKEMSLRTKPDNYFPEDFYKLAGLFLYEKDKQGMPTLYIRVQLLKKIPEVMPALKRYFLHYIYKLDEEANGNGYTMIADFTNCGYSAYEHLDLLRFTINSLHHYFPAGIDYVIVYNFPWVLKAFWNVVKYWIPPKRREIIKYTDEKTITDYISKENLPDFLGGTCKRPYKAVPEGCPTSREFGIKELGLSEESVVKIIDLYKPYL
ncbi:motile sperm domain-containing protein 2-like protein [Leptotrombidium deliense]|uniref:Motile sperm domain-containing protein 2-like protein n=1 Tax=Leptotrombidium deliense TaxID=299467 RepID=A0A443SBX1_9ACAR|nr:motile sperm domain-containing protein 2-like protein [Leptotrombidium deliense]